MDEFRFDSTTPILLYGAAAIGNIMHENLLQQKFRVTGFIDKRAYEMTEFRGLPVYHIDDARLTPKDRASVSVIVSVKNVFEHEQIAAKLIKQGYENIIYKSKSVLNNYGSEDRIALSTLYDDILANKKIAEQNLSKTKYTILNEYKDHALILENEEGNYVIANIPLEYIYTNNYSENESKWGNVNIMAFFTHLGFFRFLSGNIGYSYEDYINEYCIYTAPPSIKITEGWKNNVMQNRAMIFEQMRLSHELDADFFIRSAPEAVWNQQGYFNLTSGKHRAAFFAATGQMFLPTKISKTDYKTFLALPDAETLNNDLQENAVTELKLPIPHPYFYKYPCLSNEYYYKMISYFSFFIARNLYFPDKQLNWKNLNIMEISENPYSILNHFSRMGCNAYHVSRRKFSDNMYQKVLHCHNIIELTFEQAASVPVDYLFVESNNEKEILTLLSQISPVYCILTCEFHHQLAIPNYHETDASFHTCKDGTHVSVLCLLKEKSCEVR